MYIFKYKYQINVDGTVAAYRFPYLLNGNSLILKQESHYYEHFYDDLKPFVHFVPINRDLSNLTKALEWSINNDLKVVLLKTFLNSYFKKIIFKAQEIIKNAQDYAQNYLTPNHIFCYYAKFFQV